MIYQEIINQNTLVLDNNQKKVVAGKIEFLDPTSRTPVNIYTYNSTSESYTVATNPIYLDVNSRPEYTYFVKQLTYCRLYKYMGNFSDPMVDDDTNNWEFVRDWYGAYNEDEAKNDTIVNGLSSVKSANTEIGKLTVVGYWNNDDCEARTYIWDATCNQDQDNGYIIKSNNSDTGRWILKFDGEYLPSTYYGVYPGHEENINALLNYIDTVGSSDTPTAPGVYFVHGFYDAATTRLTTTKKLLVDADTYFTRTEIECNDLKVVGHATNAICDFKFNGKNAEAHSSWYKSAQAFLQSNAQTFVFDEDNHFSTNTITVPVTMVDKTIVASKTPSLNYTNTGYLYLTNCVIVGHPFNKNTRVKFVRMYITDDWFYAMTLNDWDFGAVTQGKHIEATTNNLCTLNINNFKNNNVYLKAVVANGDTSFNGGGRKYTSSYGAKFTTVKNAEFTNYGIVDGITGSFVTFDDCKIDSMIVNRRGTFVNFNNSEVTTTASFDNVSQLYLKKSKFTMSYNSLNLSNTSMFFEDSEIDASITYTRVENSDITKRYVPVNTLSIKNSVMKRTIMTKNITAVDSTFSESITIRPYYTDSKWCLGARFDGCTFTGSSKVVFKLESYSSDASYIGTAEYGTLIFRNNKFYQSDEYGIYMPYLCNAVNHTLFAKIAYMSHAYKNNLGNCPTTHCKPVFKSDNHTWVTGSYNQTETYAMPSYDSARTRVWIFNDSHSPVGADTFTSCMSKIAFVHDISPIRKSSSLNATMRTIGCMKCYDKVCNTDEVDKWGAVDGCGDMFLVRPIWWTYNASIPNNIVIECRPSEY